MDANWEVPHEITGACVFYSVLITPFINGDPDKFLKHIDLDEHYIAIGGRVVIGYTKDTEDTEDMKNDEICRSAKKEIILAEYHRAVSAKDENLSELEKGIKGTALSILSDEVEADAYADRVNE